LKLDDALQRIVQTTIDLCLADQLVILLWDEQSNELHLRAEHGLGKRKTGFITVPVKKNSPIFEVLQKGEPFRSNGLSDHKHEVVKGYFVNHAFYAPLTVGDVSNGILVAIRQNKENEFTLEEEQLLCAVARFAATAVFNSQKNETSHRQLERKVEELSTYNSISKVLAQTNNLTGIYGVLREHIRKHWHVENIGLWLVEEATDRLVPFPKPSFHKTYSIGEEMVGAVASSAVPVLASNIKLFSEPMKSVEPTLQLLARSAICVPVMEHNQVLGVLAAFSTRENEFGQQDVEWLQTLSQAASSAIRNAWLFEQVNNQRATIVAAVNMLPHPMMIVDQDGKISISNKAADAMLEEVHSTTNEKNCDFMPLYTLLNGLSESKWQTREIIIGEKVYVATLEYASMVGTVILMQDVTDPVTGVLSRRHFHDLAKQAFQQSKRYTNPLAALVIGLDDLGRMAAAHGYAIRNQILREFVSELRKSLRSPDILGRYQDDKFAVILPETTLENAMVVSERIIQSMSRKTITVENFRMACQVSIGAAMLDSDADDSVEVFLEKAHGALKLAENV
jgi:diguanylate cyclase (GGDEF) domain